MILIPPHTTLRTHTHTLVLPSALKGVFSLLLLNRSLLGKLEIKGCDFRLEDQSAGVGGALSARH